MKLSLSILFTVLLSSILGIAIAGKMDSSTSKETEAEIEMSKEYQLGIIGFGAMGKSIYDGIVADYEYSHANKLKNLPLDPVEIIVFDADQSRIPNDIKATKAKSLEELLNHRALLIAVKPQNVDDLLKELKTLSKETTIISIAAGAKIEKFEKVFPSNPVVRVMPNTPAQIRKGISAIAGNELAKEKGSLDLAARIFSSVGETLFVFEPELDAITALSGSGPAYVFYMMQAMAEAGIELGLAPSDAAKLAVNTAYGAASLAKRELESLEGGPLPASLEATEFMGIRMLQDLRSNVTSPGGTTEAGIKSLESDKFAKTIQEAIEKAYKRSKELSE